MVTFCILLAFLAYRKHHQPPTILWHSGGNTVASTFTNDMLTPSDSEESPSYTFVPTQPVTYQNAEPILPLHPETFPSSFSILYHQRFLPFTFPNH